VEREKFREGDDGEVSEDGNEDFISDDDEVEVTDDEDKGSSYHVPSDLDDLFD
jgi:hypothetical protein